MISNCMLLPTTKLSSGLHWEGKEEGALRRLTNLIPPSSVAPWSVNCQNMTNQHQKQFQCKQL